MWCDSGRSRNEADMRLHGSATVSRRKRSRKGQMRPHGCDAPRRAECRVRTWHLHHKPGGTPHSSSPALPFYRNVRFGTLPASATDHEEHIPQRSKEPCKPVDTERRADTQSTGRSQDGTCTATRRGRRPGDLAGGPSPPAFRWQRTLLPSADPAAPPGRGSGECRLKGQGRCSSE